MLNPLNTNNFFQMIKPVENSPIADAQQTDPPAFPPPPLHDVGIIRGPEDLAFNAHANSGDPPAEGRIRIRACFGPIRHHRWRGFPLLNPPAVFSFRAVRNSATGVGFRAASQSQSLSGVSADERTARKFHQRPWSCKLT